MSEGRTGGMAKAAALGLGAWSAAGIGRTSGRPTALGYRRRRWALCAHARVMAGGQGNQPRGLGGLPCGGTRCQARPHSLLRRRRHPCVYRAGRPCHSRLSATTLSTPPPQAAQDVTNRASLPCHGISAPKAGASVRCSKVAVHAVLSVGPQARTFQNHTVKPGVAGFEWLHGGVRTTRSCRSQRKGPAAVNLWQSLVCRVVPGGRAHPATSVIARRTWRDGRGSLWHGVRQLSTLRTPTGARAWCMRASATQGRRPGRCGGELLEPAGPQTHASRAVSRAPQAMQFRLARCIAR